MGPGCGFGANLDYHEGSELHHGGHVEPLDDAADDVFAQGLIGVELGLRRCHPVLAVGSDPQVFHAELAHSVQGDVAVVVGLAQDPGLVVPLVHLCDLVAKGYGTDHVGTPLVHDLEGGRADYGNRGVVLAYPCPNVDTYGVQVKVIWLFVELFGSLECEELDGVEYVAGEVDGLGEGEGLVEAAWLLPSKLAFTERIDLLTSPPQLVICETVGPGQFLLGF